MDAPRIRTGLRKDETPPNMVGDFDWAREHKQELYTQYGKGVVLIFEQQVVGFGKTIAEAEQDAERNLAPEVEEITPITYFLADPNPLYRVWLKQQLKIHFRSKGNAHSV